MIGLIDVDSVLPNYALMKISSYYKGLGEHVEFVRKGQRYEKIYASAIFTRSRMECERLLTYYGDAIEIGGSGWNLKKVLPAEIERCNLDYSLYSVDIIAPRIRGIRKAEAKRKKPR